MVESREGNTPESPTDRYNNVVHQLWDGEFTTGDSLAKIVPLVLAGTNAAIELQQQLPQEAKSLLDTHRKMAQIYRLGIYAANKRLDWDTEGATPLIASFMNAYIGHTQEIIKLQSQENTK